MNFITINPCGGVQLPLTVMRLLSLRNREVENLFLTNNNQ